MSFHSMTTLIGGGTVLLSLRAAMVFYAVRASSRDSRKLTLAICWQLLGEAVISCGTVVFSIATSAGWLNSWPDSVQSSLRLFMFSCVSLTTIHLLRTSKSITEGTGSDHRNE